MKIYVEEIHVIYDESTSKKKTKITKVTNCQKRSQEDLIMHLNNVAQYSQSSDKLQITLLYKLPTHDELVNEANFENASTKSKNKPCPRIMCDIKNIPVKFLIDTGSQKSCISNKIIEKINKKGSNIPMLPLSGIKLCNALRKKFTNIRK